ncbi:hypothetical protein ACSVDE_11710 [Pseudalkalibacillus sp. Hm43]|uniref:hypothetical protein n=1 Tax=Pseudalkalibacillus sp. Hm43 TaxID=3450742 RepID=UPI003F43CC24
MDHTSLDPHEFSVICPDSCGNSPKGKLIKEITIAFAKRDLDSLSDYISDGFTWEIVGENKINGRENCYNQLCKMNKDRQVLQIEIKSIITHGREGAVNGSLILDNSKEISFCDIYQFTSAGKNSKIKVLTSYNIELK